MNVPSTRSILPALEPTEATALLSFSDIETRIVALLLGAAILTVSAKLSVPFTPVPFTLQTLAVLLIGACFGARLGGLTVAAYLLEGICGLPVLAGTPEKGLGLIYMIGPTGGFLAGFLLATIVVGILSQRGWFARADSAALAMLIGITAIYVPGLLWLGTVVGWNKPVLEWGLFPFVYGEALKVSLASILAPLIWKLKR